MYKIIIAILLSGIFIPPAKAQRLLPKQKAIEVTYGTLFGDNAFKSYYLTAGLSINGKRGNYQLWGLEYSHTYATYKGWTIPIETVCAEGGYSFSLVGDGRKNVSLNSAISGALGYESINRGNKMLEDGAQIRNEDKFVYGIGGRLSLETFLSDRFVVLIQGRAKMYWGTTTQQFRPGAGLGIRFNF